MHKQKDQYWYHCTPAYEAHNQTLLPARQSNSLNSALKSTPITLITTDQDPFVLDTLSGLLLSLAVYIFERLREEYPWFDALCDWVLDTAFAAVRLVFNFVVTVVCGLPKRPTNVSPPRDNELHTAATRGRIRSTTMLLSTLVTTRCRPRSSSEISKSSSSSLMTHIPQPKT